MVRYNSILSVIILMLSLCFSPAMAETITVESKDGDKGVPLDIAISLDIPSNVRGVAFTVHYDTEVLTLNSVSSQFFKTFAEQWATMTNPPAPLPSSQVTVGVETYDKPLVVNSVADGVMLAAAKVESGGSETVLFTLNFTPSPSIPDGLYPVSISTTFISNTAAGYPAEGIGIPPLYPMKAQAIINGMIRINATITDVDSDGIADDWEISNFGNLSTADQKSDYDGDGYTDLQEYYNFLSGLLDGEGNPYNPQEGNVAGGTGYYGAKSNSNFWLLMMPAILQSSMQ